VDAPVTWADHSFSCTDGVTLVARVWRPAGAGSWPVLLMRQPYGRAIASTPTYAHPSWYAAQGYLVVVQDVRGSGDSGGSFGGFAQEARDTAETVLWARGLPGSNGRLGTYGFSYQGLTQLLNRDPEQRPQALPDALAPAMCGLAEAEHWSCSGGAHWWALLLSWGLQLAALQCRRRGDHQGWQAIHASLASQQSLQQGLELLQQLDPDSMVLTWLLQDPAAAADWRRHQPPAALWRRPMLLIGGWHDPHLEGVLDLYRRARGAGGSPLLRIGAWTHLHWPGGVDRLQLAFFDRHLKPPEQGAMAALPAPALFDDVVRRCSAARLPEHCSGQRWGLWSGGLAAADADEGRLVGAAGSGSTMGSGTVVIVHDPWRPLPGRGGHLGLDAGLVDRADLDSRHDVACFTSEVFVEAQELLGRPQLTLEASADQPGFDLCVALSRLTPAGDVQQLSTGVARWLGAGCLRPALRHVSLQPLLATVGSGDRLRLAIALSAWPQIAVNPGSGEHPRGAAGPEHRTISVQLALACASLCMTPMVGANCADQPRLDAAPPAF